MEKRELLRKRIYKIFENQEIYNCKIFLHGCDVYEMIKILYNCGAIPYGILVTKKEENTMWGVKTFLIDDLLNINTGVIFSSILDYKNIPMEKLGKFQIYIDGLSQTEQKDYLKDSVQEKRINTVLKKGAKIYKYICQKYNIFDRNTELLVYNYTALGDAYIISLLIKEYCKEYSKDNIVITTISNACMQIFKMFNIKNVELVSLEDSNALEKLALLCGQRLNIKNLMQSPEYNGYIMKKFHGTRFNLLEMYQYYIFNLHQINDLHIDFSSLNDDTESLKFCEDMGLKKNKSIIISPYAKSMIGFNKIVWEEIVNSLSNRGFLVYTNCTEQEKPIQGTKKISFPISQAYSIIEYAGYFIGIRSGFCDVISETNAKKIFIYPDYKQFNNLGTYEFCSFKRMGFGRNCIEYKIGFEQAQELPKVILNQIENFED